jgi:hypothetical protein
MGNRYTRIRGGPEQGRITFTTEELPGNPTTTEPRRIKRGQSEGWMIIG